MSETAYQVNHHGVSLEVLAHKQSEDVFLMCHPHPLFSGNMTNKVVTTAVRCANRLGMSTVRFNFRGVGQSSGEHDHGAGEQQDVAAMLDFCFAEMAAKRVFLGGFSFGAGMACLTACTQQELVSGLFLIAPAVHHFAAPERLPSKFNSFIYMGDEDEVVAFNDVKSWVHRLNQEPSFRVFEGCSHFFHGRLVELKERLGEDIQSLL